jgi:hypothetical protein
MPPRTVTGSCRAHFSIPERIAGPVGPKRRGCKPHFSRFGNYMKALAARQPVPADAPIMHLLNVVTIALVSRALP